MSSTARRLIICGGFAVAVAMPVLSFGAAPAPVPLANCPSGEDQDLYSTACVPYLVPNTPAGNACPPGVSGAECTASSGGSFGPQMPAPVPPQEPEQELADVVTPGY